MQRHAQHNNETETDFFPSFYFLSSLIHSVPEREFHTFWKKTEQHQRTLLRAKIHCVCKYFPNISYTYWFQHILYFTWLQKLL